MIEQMRYRLSLLIKMVYADPLICLRCNGGMKIISFIQEKCLIERILKHPGLLAELARHIHSPPSSKPCEGPVVYEPFFACKAALFRRDDLTRDEQMELSQAAN